MYYFIIHLCTLKHKMYMQHFKEHFLLNYNFCAESTVDITGIDFDDDMSESSQQTKTKSQGTVNGHVQMNGEDIEQDDDK